MPKFAYFIVIKT